MRAFDPVALVIIDTSALQSLRRSPSEIALMNSETLAFVALFQLSHLNLVPLFTPEFLTRRPACSVCTGYSFEVCGATANDVECRRFFPHRAAMTIGVRLSILITSCALVVFVRRGSAQETKPAPKTQKPPRRQRRHAHEETACSAAAVPGASAAADRRAASRASTPPGENVTESVSFVTNQRERYELGDIVLSSSAIRKRTSRSAAPRTPT
jgi:hypothetical protein